MQQDLPKPFQDLKLDNIVGEALKSAVENDGMMGINNGMNPMDSQPQSTPTSQPMSNNSGTRTSVSSSNDYKIDLDIPPFLRRNKGE